MIVVLGVLGGIGQTRLVRSAVIAIKESDYFEASRAIGVSWARLVLAHVVPNVWPVLIVIFSISIAGNVLAEASLSFLGLGIPAPFPAWGSMLARDGRKYMQQAPWLSLWPGVALTLFVFAVNMFGDAVRDLLDPRLRGGTGRLGAAKTKKGR
jgi:peptide/nickel transport system permease protein